MRMFSEELRQGLVFLPELGVGYYPVPPERPYDAGYFARYKEMAATPMGQALTASRTALVARHYSGELLDVGIGSGQFVTARPQTWGYDVNPEGINWLKEQGRYGELYGGTWPALSFWDSLEHIDDPEGAIERADEWVFVSIPVFASGDAILTSRHFRKDEHLWYFTHEGLVRWFDGLGFDCLEWNDNETALGRDGIRSYAFHRR